MSELAGLVSSFLDMTSSTPPGTPSSLQSNQTTTAGETFTDLLLQGLEPAASVVPATLPPAIDLPLLPALAPAVALADTPTKLLSPGPLASRADPQALTPTATGETPSIALTNDRVPPRSSGHITTAGEPTVAPTPQPARPYPNLDLLVDIPRMAALQAQVPTNATSLSAAVRTPGAEGSAVFGKLSRNETRLSSTPTPALELPARGTLYRQTLGPLFAPDIAVIDQARYSQPAPLPLPLPASSQPMTLTAPSALSFDLSMPLATGDPINTKANTTLPTPTTVVNKEWTSGLAENVGWVVRHNARTAQVRLWPRNLGMIEIQVALDADAVEITIGASHPLVIDELVEATPRLRQMLAEQGLGLTHLEIDHSGSQRRHPATRDAQAIEGEVGPAPNAVELSPESASHVPRTKRLVDVFA